MIQRVASNLKSSFAAGARVADRVMGGSSAGTRTAAGGTSTGTGGAAAGRAPGWAKRMHRHQVIRDGISTATHNVRSGDGGGASTNLDLSEES
jgi:type IV secretion system protein TrbL